MRSKPHSQEDVAKENHRKDKKTEKNICIIIIVLFQFDTHVS